MMQHRKRQQRRRTNLFRQLLTIGNRRFKQPMPIKILVHSSNTSSLRSSSTHSSCQSSFNRRNYTSTIARNNNGAFTYSSVLLSLLAWSVTLLFISSRFGIVDAAARRRRSFFNLGCNGVYDKSLFAKLDRICEDCYNLFREPSLHSLCRQKCFTSGYFKGCLDVLLLQDNTAEIQSWIMQLRGADANL